MRYYEFDKTRARREFQKRNYLFLGLFAGALVGFPILSYLSRLIGIESALGFITVAWMIAWVGVGIWRICWRCPRCHKYFFQKWWYGSAITTKCLHCGFRPDELI
jgi:hypothetical protein